MRYAPLTGVGDRVSRLILGGLFFTPERQAQVGELLDAFVAAGGTAVDTAHSYGHGASEQGLGDWLRGRGRPDGLLIVTKCSHPERDIPRRVTPQDISDDLAESRARLGVEMIDLLLLHRDDPDVPVAPLIDRLNEHRAAGHLRAFGASNWTPERIAEANAYAAGSGQAGFAASSPNLALAIPKEPMWPGCLTLAGDAAARAWHERTQLPVLAWSSGAGGFFSGRHEQGAVVDENIARVYDRADNWERLARARALAARRGATPTQVALAWVLHQPFPTFALIGPRTPDELADCLGAADLALDAAEVAWLNLEDAPRP